MASPLLGYNNNIRHHGKVFHIQTEDSGVQHAHIFTHLFADGGRIIATKKTSYKQYLGTDRFPAIGKKLMQAQHKAMIIALRDGLFDEDELAGAREFSAREIVVEEEPKQLAQEGGSAAIDLDALDRAAASFDSSFADPVAADPTPPSGAITSVGLDSSPGVAPAGRARSSSATFPRPQTTPTPASRPGSGKYAPTAPVAARASSPAKEPSKPRAESLFGSDLLSEKSLDEVILSYLADELDEKK